HMAVWRSPLAHARITHVNLQHARAEHGVLDAFDIAAFGPGPPTFPVIVTDPALKPAPQFPLARDVVRHVGEAVAVVIAEDRALAEDALHLIDVKLEPLEPLASTQKALHSGTQQLHTTAPGNRVAEWTLRLGDPDHAFATADLVVSERIAMQRYTGVPIETRC